jgi:hypothetical protein
MQIQTCRQGALPPAHPAPVRLFSVDLNGTLLGNPEATAKFTAAWNHLEPGERPQLIYTCGRSIADITRVVHDHRLPAPAAMIGGLGTSLKVEGHELAAAEFNAQYEPGWNFARVEEMLGVITGMWRAAPSYLHPYKSEWRWRNAAPEELHRLESRLREAGIKGTVLYTENRYVDVVPAETSKGAALHHLCSLLAIPLDAVLVAGDTLHDASTMLLPKVRRILVDNSLPDLLAELVGLDKFFSPLSLADGVMDGLSYFGVLPRNRFL